MLKLAIEPSLRAGDQSWNYQVHWLAEKTGVMLRANIRRNAYDSQSFVRAEAFDKANNQWHVIASLDFAKAACQPISYVMRSLTAQQQALFAQDAKRVIDMAMVIIQEPGVKLPLAA